MFVHLRGQVSSTSINSLSNRRTNNNIVSSILRRQYERNKADLTGRKTSGVISERLVAFSGYNLSDTANLMLTGKSDSGYFMYSGQEGSEFNYQMMDFVVTPDVAFTSPLNENYPLTYNIAFDFPSMPDVPEMFPDSAYLWANNTSSGVDSFYYADRSTYSYSNTILQQDNQFQPDLPGQNQRINFYYASGKLTSAIYLNYSGSTSTWDTVNIVSYAYNGSGELVMDSATFHPAAGVWIIDYKFVYTYDGSGNISSIDDFVDSSGYWQASRRMLFSYNTDNTLHTASVNQYSGGTLIPFSLDSFGYTTGVNYFTFEKTSVFLSDTVACTYLKHVSGAGLPDTVTYSYFINSPGLSPQLMMAKKVSFVYDTLENPVVASAFNYIIADSFAWTGSYAATAERIFYYHYQTYELSDVKNVVAQAPVKIYPNPATSEITILRPGVSIGSASFVTITNMAGQPVIKQKFLWARESESLAVSELPRGIYILTIADKDGSILTTQKVTME